MKGLTAWLVMSVLMASSALADFATHPLIGHAGSMLSGSENFSGAAGGGGTLDVDVDYAVFAPGQFQAQGGIFIPFGGFGPLNPADYVYTYQIYNVGPANGGTSNVSLSSLNIQFGPIGTVDSLGFDLNFDPALLDVNATLAFNFPPTASYLFFLPPLGVDQYSTVLLLSSPQGPTMQAISNVIDGGTTINGFLPAPIPSPAAAVLGLIGLACVGGIRRQRVAA